MKAFDCVLETVIEDTNESPMIKHIADMYNIASPPQNSL